MRDEFKAIAEFIVKTRKTLAVLKRNQDDILNWRRSLRVGALKHKGKLIATSSTMPETLTTANLQAITWTVETGFDWIAAVNNTLAIRTHLPETILGLIVQSHVGDTGPLTSRDVLTHNQQVSLSFSTTQMLSMSYQEGLQNDILNVVVSLDTNINTGTLPANSKIMVYELV